MYSEMSCAVANSPSTTTVRTGTARAARTTEHIRPRMGGASAQRRRGVRAAAKIVNQGLVIGRGASCKVIEQAHTQSDRLLLPRAAPEELAASPAAPVWLAPVVGAEEHRVPTARTASWGAAPALGAALAAALGAAPAATRGHSRLRRIRAIDAFPRCRPPRLW